MKDALPDFAEAPARTLCTDCGVSRMKDPSACGAACQFIKPDYDGAESRVHGRKAGDGDETFFGVTQAMYRAALTPPKQDAQWTGITTRLAEKLLEDGAVDAVLTMVPDAHDRWKPVPAIITQARDMARARGMRMGYAPLLALLEPAAEAGHKKIAVIGIPCQVYALRALEEKLGFERIYAIGTPCSDNTTTENFHSFVDRLTDAPETVTYLEFRADYHVELRFENGRKELIPFLKLPISDLPADFFPLTCKTCVDYTNRLADITVGYMAGEGDQWLIVRNGRGAEMLAGIRNELTLDAPRSKGNRTGAVKGFITNTRLAAGGLPVRRMPNFMRGVMGWLMPKIGPRGLEFARARLEMKAAETVLHLEREAPAKMKNMVPKHVWQLVAPYGFKKSESRNPRDDTHQ
ncbi:coenzyme F420 hydrogenase subunit beta [Cognatiyoonia koreensis]|uniref:Coenzyme F420 hydrogenase subunit beta n=1 Tax=Cognatiyoonia koreensis TaxID=364200 RepID=A0A1I0RG77_9RHOB|nr:Coenzyme F420 hydrogenase/dehydrogenase, beta subunit C-terminal domain [Cognatiyoonia koreensis]SEW39259.1 coenzyme F420 hydrogenase subunit beta [Cognatiyoonia koreensis]